MKVYILTESDFENLRLRLRQDPYLGIVPDDAKRMAHLEAQRTIVYHVETWINDAMKPSKS